MRVGGCLWGEGSFVPGAQEAKHFEAEASKTQKGWECLGPRYSKSGPRPSRVSVPSATVDSARRTEPDLHVNGIRG